MTLSLLLLAIDGRGVGSLLVRWVVALARAHGLRGVLVAASGQALGFWKRLGFEEPPDHVPQAWTRSLAAQFERASVLHLAADDARAADECEAQLEVAVERVRATGGGKRRRLS